MFFPYYHFFLAKVYHKLATKKRDNQEDYLYILFNVYFTCNDYYRLMKCKLEVNDFGCVKEYYDELINALKRFEEQYKICIYEKGRF